METKQFVVATVGIMVLVLLVGAVFTPAVSSSTYRTVTTIEENDSPEWLKFGYAQAEDYTFEVEIDGSTLNVGTQSGELKDMIVFASDTFALIVMGDSVYFVGDDVVYNLGSTVTVAKGSDALTITDADSSTESLEVPLWAYYPLGTGNYGYFAHGDLIRDSAEVVAWGNFAGVTTYNNYVVPNVGLVADVDATSEVINSVKWVLPEDEELLEIQPFNPDDVIFNPIDLEPIDIDPINPFNPGENVIMSADPQNGTRVGDLYYTFNGTEASCIGYSSSINWSTTTIMPDTVESDGVTYTVTSIGNNAFSDRTALAFTSLPSGLTSIGNYAFSGCTNLALTSLPSGLTSIGTETFSGCTNLALTSLPSGLTSIGSKCFKSCMNLALTSLPSGLNTVGSSAFDGCTNLALTSLPSGWTTINSGVFWNCTHLSLTELPTGLTSIDSSVFNGCTNLALTSLPSGLTSIGNAAFYHCTNLALTSLPSGLTSIGTNVFAGCTNLALTSLPSGLTSIGTSAFEGCTGLTGTLVIPDGVTTIYSSAFIGCTGLTGLELYSGLTHIGGSAFSGCTHIAGTVIIPDTVVEIGNYAFQNCYDIENLVILCSTTNIGASSFSSTSALKEVLNLGSTEITTTSYGLNADEVRTDIDASGYIAVLKTSHSELVQIDNPVVPIINLLPVVLGVGVLMVTVVMMIYNRPF